MLSVEAILDGDPWQVAATDWPSDGPVRKQLLFLLNYAVLAPSILNTQPWSFTFKEDGLIFHEDRSRRMTVVDPGGRQSVISCGAALENLEVAAHSFGRTLMIDVLPSKGRDDALAAISLRQETNEPSKPHQKLRDAIIARRTIREKFDPSPLDIGLLKELAELAASHKVEVAWIADAETKLKVAQIVGEAERTLLADPNFRNEIRKWIRQRDHETHEALRELYARMGPASGHSPQSRAHRTR